MNARVESHVYGGRGTAIHADLDQFGTVATLLNDAADHVARTGANWRTANLELGIIRAKAPLCPKLLGKIATASMGRAHTDGAGEPEADTAVHMSLNYQLVLRHADERAEEAEMLMRKAQTMADQLTDAYSLYSEADETARGLFGELLQLGTTVAPKFGFLGLLGAAAGSVVIGSIKEQSFNPVYAVTGTSSLHEGMLSALGSAIVNGANPITRLWRAGTGLVESDEVNQAAGMIAHVSALTRNILVGNKVTVTQIHPKKGIGETTSIEDTLNNVHDMRLNGVDYGSIAIQKYRREDGTTAWMVTIPGTDGNFDSPFSWFTNVELMSADERQRKAADSARMVDEAMRQAGIQPGDPVAMVGHSQGGIVAAVMASDFTDKYNIQHIVTAGSPIANHPIRDGITVTSIEVDDELVSALDGAPNPSGPNWLTVRGTSQPMGSGTGTEVEGSGDQKSLSHDMNYMKATYQNAKGNRGTALTGHERHFRQVINGELQETTYWRGRIGRK